MSAVPAGTIPYLAGRAAQPAALERITDHVAAQLADIAWQPAVRLPVLVGIGASHAALALPVRILREAGLAARRELAGDLGPGAALEGADLVLGVSQSGRSTETLEALAHVPRGQRAALVNAVSSPLSAAATRCIDLGGEPDSYASTVGYTGTLIGLTMTARALTGVPLARIRGEWTGIGKLLERHERAIGPVVDELAGCAAPLVAADVVAAGAAASAAEAGALLLREVCRLPASALVTRNYLHGAMESAGRTLHIVIGDGRELELARTLASAGHTTLAVTSAPLTGGGHLHIVRMPDDMPLPVLTVLETVVLQRLAAALADARGVEIEDFVFDNTDTKTEEPAA